MSAASGAGNGRTQPVLALDLEKYFSHASRDLRVTRGELRYIISLLVERDTMAEALQVFDYQWKKEIPKLVDAAVEQRIKEARGEAESGGGIILPPK